MDFMSDGLYSGRRFRTFNIIDDFNRESLSIKINSSLSTTRGEVCDITDAWMIDSNYERPHESLNDLPPKIYEQQLTCDYSI